MGLKLMGKEGSNIKKKAYTCITLQHRSNHIFPLKESLNSML